jgi:hypothetical protein
MVRRLTLLDVRHIRTLYSQPGKIYIEGIPAVNLISKVHTKILMPIYNQSSFSSPSHHTNIVMSSPPSNQSSRASSITVAHQHSPSKAHGTTSFVSTLKKPFQGWSRELLRARDDDDDDYNFASGLRRGCEQINYRSD